MKILTRFVRFVLSFIKYDLRKMIDNRDLQEIERIRKSDYKSMELEYMQRFPFSDFPGNYPVRSLKYNIVSRFSNLSKEAQILMNTQIDWISNAIKYDYNDDNQEMRTPLCIPDSIIGKFVINFSERFVAYIWVCVYYLLLQNEAKSQKLFLDKVAPNEKVTDRMLKRADELLKWAVNFGYGPSGAWPVGYPSSLPTPNLYDNEIMYSLLANNLCINAMIFILYHEFGHAYRKDIKRITEDSIEQEQKADAFAIDLCLDPTADKVKREGMMLSILMAFDSLLFLVNDKSCLSSDTHPHPIERIRTVLDAFETDNKITPDELRNIKINQLFFYGIVCRYYGTPCYPSKLEEMNIDKLLRETENFLKN